MQIKEYLFYNQISMTDFAKLIDVQRHTLYRIVNGQIKNLNTEVAEKIVKGTQGVVTYEDLLAECNGKKPSHPLMKQDEL